MKINIKEISSVEELKNHFLGNKSGLKYNNYSIERPHMPITYVTGKNVYVCNETGTEFCIHGIGDKKINIDSYWYTWETIFKAINRDYTKNSQTLNSFILYFFDEFKYEHFNDDTIKDIIKNRENTQYLTIKEIPKYIPRGFIMKYCNGIELPVVKKVI